MTTLTMTRGDDRVLRVDATEDLTGVTSLKFTAKRFRSDEDAVFQKTLGSGIALDTDTSVALVSVQAVDTADLDATALYWDAQVVDGAGLTKTLAKGRLVVTGDITR